MFTVGMARGPGQYIWSNDLCVASLPLRRLDDNPAVRFSLSNQVIRVSGSRHHLVCKNPIRGSEKKLLVRGWDDQGRSFVGKFAGGGADLQFYDLRLPSDAKSIDLQLIPERPVKVEFFVKPPVPPAESAR